MTLFPVLATGLNSGRQSRNQQLTAQIAQTLIEEARQGTLVAGPANLDFQGAPCPMAQAAYTAWAGFTPLAAGDPASPQRLTLRVVPLGQADHAQIYVVVLPASVPTAVP